VLLKSLNQQFFFGAHKAANKGYFHRILFWVKTKNLIVPNPLLQWVQVQV
jgi:hypothetical protein